MMRLNEVRKVQAKELALVKEQAGMLEQRIAIKDSTIQVFEQRIDVTQKMINTYDTSISNLQGQIGIHKSVNDQLKRDLKTANKKRVMNKFFYGGIAAVALVLLAIK